MRRWGRRRMRKRRWGRRRRKEQKKKRCDITYSHLIIILTACRDEPLPMNSNARDS